VLAVSLLAGTARADEADHASQLEARVRLLEEQLAALRPDARLPLSTCAPYPALPPPDVAEPTYGEFDDSWMNGNNSQPASLLVAGPITGSLYIDTYTAWQFSQPIDHTIVPTTTAPRHNELSLNLAHLGIDVTGLDGPIGRL
jgi:hypothetical protein